MIDPTRVRSPRDSHSAPPRLDRADAEAAAERVLADYRRYQQAATQDVGRGRSAARWVVVIVMAVLGAGAGALLGSVRGLGAAGAGAMGLLGIVLGVIATRR